MYIQGYFPGFIPIRLKVFDTNFHRLNSKFYITSMGSYPIFHTPKVEFHGIVRLYARSALLSKSMDVYLMYFFILIMTC